MSVYQFDFAHLTVGDYTALVTAAESRNTVAFLSVVNAFSDIDVFSLPFSELQSFTKQFGDALNAHAQSADPVLRLLRQALAGEE